MYNKDKPQVAKMCAAGGLDANGIEVSTCLSFFSGTANRVKHCVLSQWHSAVIAFHLQWTGTCQGWH